MAQQMINGSYYNESQTITFRMSDRYAVVEEPFHGKHLKPQDVKSKLRRHMHWINRNSGNANE